MKIKAILLGGLVSFSLAGPWACHAHGADEFGHTSFEDSANLTLEQLVNIEVTSVSKKETRLNDSAAAISVITQEDFRRSGATSIPDALRMVPGLDVAQINSSQWAISSRGFNNQFANKLLVLVDGRSIYTPTFAGVFWENTDLVLADLDRIEVIRGPGATLWGANAVNGVINIITKSARDTQGLLVSTTGGTEYQPSTSIRYGDHIGTNLFYRVYVKYVNADSFVNATGAETPDDWDVLRGGARLDWEPHAGDALTLQGDYYSGSFGSMVQSALPAPPYSFPGVFQNKDKGGNIIGRWTHDFSADSQLTLQLYYDHFENSDALNLSIVDVYDIDLQHRFKLGDRHDIVWGAEARYTPDSYTSTSELSFSPSVGHNKVYSAFVQDDITLVENRFHAVLGSKFERNSYTGFEFQPSGRLLWTPSERQTIWSAVSRAVRSPSRLDDGAQYNLSAFPAPPGFGVPVGTPVVATVLGNSSFESEELIAYELGYRVEPVSKLAVDIATFYNDYHHLRDFVTGAPFPGPGGAYIVLPQYTLNSSAGEAYGTEVSVQWKPVDYLRLMASYTWLDLSIHPDNLNTVHDNPQNQAQLRAFLDLPHHIEVNGGMSYVDTVSNQGVPSYIRLDLGVSWRPSKSWEFAVWGQNLLDDQHPEFGSYRTPVITEIPRSFYGKVTWRF